MPTELEEQEERDAQAAREAERKRLAELEEKNRDLELREARAQAALEESRRRPAGGETPQPQGMTEAGWQELERMNPGKSREEIMAEAQRIAQIADARLGPVRKELEDTRRAAEEARAETARLKRGKSLEEVERKFFEKHTALKSHQGEVEEFLNSYPDRDQADAATHEKRLALALDLVKGRVKEKNMRRGESESRSRLEVDTREGEERTEASDEFDAKGLTEEEALWMRRRHENLGKDPSLLDPEGTTKAFKEVYTRNDPGGRGEGVALDTWAEDKRRALARK